MADQRPWWKLWVTALSDDDLEALTLEDWARWARLGAHLKAHGEGGAMTCRRPGRALAKLWRSPRWKSLLAIAQRLPGVSVEPIENGPAGTPDAVTIRMKNWKKYQEDSSTERTRKWRQKHAFGDAPTPSRRDAHQPSPRPSPERACDGRSDDVEEKRREIDSPPVTVTTPKPEDDPTGLFNDDCPTPYLRWRGHCVNRAFLAAHPDVKHYPARNKEGTPKQCPHHREAREP